MGLFVDVITKSNFESQLTPLENKGHWLVKRDDLYEIAGIRGGKARTCWALAQGARGLVTAGSRGSPQANIVAHVARALGIPARVHTTTGELSPELVDAKACGADIIQHKAGYNNVIIARAHEDAKARDWREIPFGMECLEAVRQTRGQVRNLAGLSFQRLVVPVGSGMSLAGILWGLRDYDINVPVIGVRVGADPSKRLDTYAPANWRQRVILKASELDYHEPSYDFVVFGQGHTGIEVDPYYEGKCLEFLQPGDLFWIVGIRRTATACNRPKAVA